MDSQYLKTHVGSCLVNCLAEVSEKRPADPIEYIAQWLYNYKDNLKRLEQLAEQEKKLQEEKEEFARQQEALELRRQEQIKLRKEEEERQKALEAEKAAAEALSKESTMPGAPNLPPVQEGDEPAASVDDTMPASSDIETAGPVEGTDPPLSEDADDKPQEQTEEGESEAQAPEDESADPGQEQE